MSNHILHPLGDRLLCEPTVPNRSARDLSTDPTLASCVVCLESYAEGMQFRPTRSATYRPKSEALVAVSDSLAEPLSIESSTPAALTLVACELLGTLLGRDDEGNLLLDLALAADPALRKRFVGALVGRVDTDEAS